MRAAPSMKYWLTIAMLGAWFIAQATGAVMLYKHELFNMALSLAVFLLLQLFGVIQLWRLTTLPREHTHSTDNQEPDAEAYRITMRGIFISPFRGFVIRVWLAATVGQIITLGLQAAALLLESEVLDALEVAAGLWLVFSILLAWPNQPSLDEKEGRLEVPNNMLGIITWLGNRWNWFLTEGKHPWLPTWLGFGINRTPLPENKNLIKGQAGPEQGLSIDGGLTINLEVWDSAGAEENSEQRNLVSVVTRTGSGLKISFLVRYCVRDPSRYANTANPVLTISEQARSGLRNAVAFFRDIDVTSLKSVISPLTEGKVIFVAFTTHDLPDIPTGSVVRDLAGAPMTRVFKYPHNWKEMSTEDREQAIQAELTVFKEAVQVATAIDAPNGGSRCIYDGKWQETTLSVAEKLIPVIQNCGAELLSTTNSNIILSDEVAQAARRAEAAQRERVRILTLAAANAEAAERTHERTERLDDFAKVAPLAQQGKARITHITGPAANPLNQAAAIFSDNQGGNDQ